MKNLNEIARAMGSVRYSQILKNLTEVVKNSEEECVLKIKDRIRGTIKTTFKKDGDKYQATIKDKFSEHTNSGDIEYVKNTIQLMTWGADI